MMIDYDPVNEREIGLTTDVPWYEPQIQNPCVKKGPSGSGTKRRIVLWDYCKRS